MVEKVVPEKEKFDSKSIPIENIPRPETTTRMESDGESTPKKRGRGRRSKAEIEQEQRNEILKISEDIFTPVFALLNRFLVARYTEVVRLSDDEIDTLKYYLAIVANKYSGEILSKFGAEITLGILSLTIISEKTIKYQLYVKKNAKPDNNSTRKKGNGQNVPNSESNPETG
mgnify:CR=1 FL=1